MNKAINLKVRNLLRTHTAQQIKSKRKRSGLTLGALAEMIDYRQTSVSMWEVEQASPPLCVLYLLSIIFDCPVTDFLLPLDDFIDKGGLKLKSTTVTIKRITVDDQVVEGASQ